MFRFSRWVMLLVLLVGTSWVRAQTVEPVSADQTSPRGTVKMLTEAMEKGSPEEIGKLLHTEKPIEKRVADSMIEMASVISTLRQTSIKRFGQEAETEFKEDPTRIDKASETVEGDMARVSYPDTPVAAAIVLKQVDGQWVLPVSELVRDVPQEYLEELLVQRQVEIRLIREISEELAQGKYNSVQETMDSLQGRIQRAVMQQSPPATQPSTQPAATPATQPAVN
jgi:hypothetical protein